MAEWRPMSEAPRMADEYILICQPGSTDHYAVCDYSDSDEDGLGLAWRHEADGEVWMTDADMEKAYSPAMWCEITPPPSSLSSTGPTPEWVLAWRAAWRA